jgi:Fe2+ transport system protein B
LWRAIIVAIPAGILIWLFANLNIHQVSIFNIITKFLDPFGKIMGLDGTILAAFLLGMPANEIVFPLIIMSYTNNLSLIPIENFNNINQILKINGWNATTIICTIIFYLYHFPCSTTLLTIKKETGSLKLTLLAFILPTLIGIILCIGFNFLKTSNFFL